MKSDWFKKFRSRKNISSHIGSFDPVRFEELCAEDPHAATELLQHDFKELQGELEEAVIRFRRSLSTLGTRLEECRKNPESEYVQSIREEHDQLRRTLRRLDASVSETRDLEEELKDWEDRRGEHGPIHADHPSVRAEIVRSEIVVRTNGESRAYSKEKTVLAYRIHERKAQRSASKKEADILIQMIQHATAEAECWHDVPVPSRDAIEQIRNVRRLHALLKQLDREVGKRRDRTELIIRTRST